MLDDLGGTRVGKAWQNGKGFQSSLSFNSSFALESPVVTNTFH